MSVPIIPIFDLVNKSFQYEQNEFHSIVVDEQVWFRAKDICSFLGYADPAKTIVVNVSHRDVALLSFLIEGRIEFNPAKYTHNQLQSKYINEAGFYTLVLKSRKPAAKAFCRYVTGEILPGIRKQYWEKQQEEHRAQLNEKDDAIASLQREQQQTNQFVKELQDRVGDLEQKTDYVLDEFHNVADRSVVPPADDQLQEVAILYRIDSNPDIGEFTHGVVRVQRRSEQSALAKKRKRHPNLEVVARIDPAVNSRQLVHKLKELYPGDAYFKGNSIELFDETEEPELVREFQKAHELRMQEANSCAEIVAQKRAKLY